MTTATTKEMAHLRQTIAMHERLSVNQDRTIAALESALSAQAQRADALQTLSAMQQARIREMEGM